MARKRVIAGRMRMREAVGMEDLSSPWGTIQDSHEIAPGITSVSTAGHGGVKLDRSRNAQIPAYMRRPGGWYEEDCDWCLPAVVFEQEWRKWADSTTWTTSNKEMESAEETLRNWHPLACAKWHNVPLESLAGKSCIYDEQCFRQQHANDLVVICACGDWHEDCPRGMVLVTATLGGTRGSGEPGARSFLVPKEDYDKRGRFGFVLDPAKYQEVPVE